jgi:hypothetical protein
VLKIAEHCSREQGEFSIAKFKQSLFAAFRNSPAPSPRRANGCSTPQQSRDIGSLIGNINRDLDQLNSRLQKEDPSTQSRRPLEDCLLAIRNNSKELSRTLSKELEPRPAGPADCLFTF